MLNRTLLTSDKIIKFKLVIGTTFKKIISNGAQTLKEVQEATGAGSGSCGGRRCTVKIQELLNELNKEER